MWEWEKEVARMAVRFGPKQWEDGAGMIRERQEVEHVCMRNSLGCVYFTSQWGGQVDSWTHSLRVGLGVV